MLERLHGIQVRLGQQGGVAQQDRMIKDKKKSLDKALLYSYQGANINKIGEEITYRALINPDKTKQDYDDKILSINFVAGFKPGDVFEWQNTGTKWLVYLQNLTELAYFRAEIRKCRYEIDWVNSEGKKCKTYVAVRGPVETKVNFIQKEGISLDEPNHTLNILLPRDEESLKYFKRYSLFYINDYDICWRVEGIDSVSMPGIIELTAVEYYSNKDTDLDENGNLLANAIKLKTITEEKTDEIVGEGFIKPKIEQVYEYTGNQESSWSFENKKVPVEYKTDGKKITVKWIGNYSGQFTIIYGTSSKTIVVESLF